MQNGTTPLKKTAFSSLNPLLFFVQSAKMQPDIPVIPFDKLERIMENILKKMNEIPNYLIMSVGDSLTEGQRASGAELTYTAVFTAGLAKQFPDRSVVRIDGKRVEDRIARFNRVVVQERPEENGKITVVRSGYGGNTVQRLINRKEDFIGCSFEDAEPNLYMISVGINDSIDWDEAKYATPAQYKENLRTLLGFIRQAHPAADVIMITPTPYCKGDDGDDNDLAYAKAMLEFAAEERLPCLDMHQIWLDHRVEGEKNFGMGDWLYDGDRCHPGDVGHDAFAQALLKFMFK